MTSGLMILCYCIVAYGISNMFVFGSGPFRIFEWIRYIANRIGDHFGTLFTCMMCFPANFGLFFSLFDWFFLSVPITPFNIAFIGTDLWWLAAILDCCFTSGVVWFIHHVEEYFEDHTSDKNVITEEIPEDDLMTVEDITKNGKV